MDVNTGVLSLNKALEESDFAELRESDSSEQKRSLALYLVSHKTHFNLKIHLILCHTYRRAVT